MPELSDVKIKVSTDADTKGLDEAEKRIAGFSQSTVDASKKIALGLAGVGTAFIGFAGFGVKMAGDMEAARQGFLALLGSADKADATMSRIKKEAAATPFELPGLVAGTQALAAITKDGDKAIDMLLNVGKAIAVSGKGQAELDRVVLNLQQIAATGKVTAMDIRQFQGAIPIFNDIVTSAGMTIEQLQNADNAAELLGLAFQAAGEKGGIAAEGFTAQAGTWNQLFSNFKDNMGIIAAEFVTQTGIFDLAKQVLGSIVNFMGQLVTPERIAQLKQLTQWLQEHQPLLVILAATIMGLLLPAIVALGASVLALFTPWTLAVLAIGALVAGLYLIWTTNFLGIQDIVMGVVNWFMTYVWPTIQKIFTWIGAALTTLWQIFQNVWNVLIKPLLGAFVAYLDNTFWKPIKAIFDLMTAALHAMGLSWSDVWNGIKAVVFGIFNAIVNEVKSRINFVIDAINLLIRGANKVGGKIPGYTQVNEIPKLAKGTNFFPGGMAIVGEHGPEIVNLPRGSQVIPNSEINKGGITVNQTNNIYSGEDTDLMLRNLAFAVATA